MSDYSCFEIQVPQHQLDTLRDLADRIIPEAADTLDELTFLDCASRAAQ